jgi:uncharacterized protein (TIGR03083 family)
MTQENGPLANGLVRYVDIWWRAVDDFTTLLEKLPEEAWSAPTDLAGWDVHAVVAHTAHLESLLAGKEHVEVEVGDAPHVRNPLGAFTEQGVVARRDRTPDDLLIEIRESTTARRTRLLEEPPTDPDAPAPGPFGAIGWSTLTLLRNRPLDVWMHEQDVRRAIGKPGGMDSPAAQHTADYLSESLGMVVAKRVGAPAGTTVVLDLEGSEPVTFGVNESGRGEQLADPPGEPTVRLTMDRESFIVLAGGRRAPDPGAIRIDGDDQLGQRIVDTLAVTP